MHKCSECGVLATIQVYYTNWYAHKVENYLPLCKDCLSRIEAKMLPQQNLGYLSIICKPLEHNKPLEVVDFPKEEHCASL